MTLQVPIVVRLTADRSERIITCEVRSPAYSSTDPGGYATASFALERPLDLPHDYLDAYTKVVLSDGRHGGVLWEGRLEDPGRSAGPDGEIWQITAVGGGAHAEDNSSPVVYVDTIDFGQLMRAGSSHRKADVGDDVSNDEPAFRAGFDRGFLAATNDLAGFVYQQTKEALQKIGRLATAWEGGRTSANWRVRLRTFPSNTLVFDVPLSTAGGALAGFRAGADFPSTDSYIRFELAYTGAGGQIDVDTTWAVFKEMYVVGARVGATGVALPDTVYTKGTVNPEDVIRDQIGRHCPKFDAAVIAAGGYEMDHLVYIDGAAPAKVFADMMLVDPSKSWYVWESGSDGRYLFEWKTRPTSVRFETSAADGFDSPGSTLDLYNRVVVRWRDRKGRIRWVVRTRTVDVLDAAGLTRTAFINLADELGSAANAAQVGDAFLAEHAYPPNAGTLTINHPIFDTVLGRMVWPWELVRHAPGSLIRVRDVAPRVDALNATERDGVTVFRVVGVTYSPESGAVLSLDSTPRRLTALLAQQRRDFDRARRR